MDYGGQHYEDLKLLVVEGSGPNLMGRDWLRVVKLNWKSIASSEGTIESRVSALQDKHQEVFSEMLGTISPYQAKLSVAKDAKPKFFKPHFVPFALKERVNIELDRLEEAGVIEKTMYSEWAAPIVAVPKRGGRLHLCGDYKVMINHIDQYPLPKQEDIFAMLAGGQKFTTLDLAHTYNQLLLDEDSRKYVTISTPKEWLVCSTVLTHYDPAYRSGWPPLGVRAIISHVFPDGSERPVVLTSPPSH